MNSWTADMADTFARCFIREDRYKLLISGIGVTIKVSIVAVILGILIGFLIALCNLSKNKFLRAIGKIYTDIIRGTPSVTQRKIIGIKCLPDDDKNRNPAGIEEYFSGTL